MKEDMQENPIIFQRINHFLGEIPFFQEFLPEELDFFSNNLSLRSVPEDTCLFNKGDVGDYMFFIVNGAVEVRLETSDLSQIIIANFGPGSTVGEMSIIDDYSRSATVLVTESSELLILTRKRFDAICKENPIVGLKFIRALAKNLSARLRKTNGRFADLV